MSILNQHFAPKTRIESMRSAAFVDVLAVIDHLQQKTKKEKGKKEKEEEEKA